MKKAKKILTLALCAALLVCISVGATVAYLTSQTEEVKNTFTVGKVAIDLDEAKVDVYGKEVGTDRVKANAYKLMPGHKYVKDPTVTVKANSEASYIRMLVTITDIADVKTVIGAAKPESIVDGKFLPQYFVEGWDSTKWISTGVIEEKDNAATYEFRYYTTVSTVGTDDKVLEDLFTHIVVPQNIVNTELDKLEQMEIKVIAQAIQADGFGTADLAWAQWKNN